MNLSDLWFAGDCRRRHGVQSGGSLSGREGISLSKKNTAQGNETQNEIDDDLLGLDLDNEDVGYGEDEEDDDEGSESEDGIEYTVGGYHPVTIGDTFKDGRYLALRKLGWGHSSTVWLCYDVHRQMHVAIKLQKSAAHYTEAAKDEIQLLNELAVKDPTHSQNVLKLLDSFEHQGIFGTHVCLVFEALGKSLLSLIRKCSYNGCDLELVKLIAFQLLSALDYSHSVCGIIHTDIKPENILFVMCEQERARVQKYTKKLEHIINAYREQRANAMRVESQNRHSSGGSGTNRKRNETDLKTPKKRSHAINIDRDNNNNNNTVTHSTKEDGENNAGIPASLISKEFLESEFQPELHFASGRVRLVDFGNACWIDQHFSEEIQTRQYRSPEVILGAGYDQSADIWSLACVLFEVATGDFLFDPRPGRDYDRNEDHFALMMELLGAMPQSLVLDGSRSHLYFSGNGKLRHIKRMNFWSLREVLKEKYGFQADDADAFSSFLLPMLVFEPDMRATAAECLKHPWLQSVASLFPKNPALSEFERVPHVIETRNSVERRTAEHEERVFGSTLAAESASGSELHRSDSRTTVQDSTTETDHLRQEVVDEGDETRQLYLQHQSVDRNGDIQWFQDALLEHSELEESLIKSTERKDEEDSSYLDPTQVDIDPLTASFQMQMLTKHMMERASKNALNDGQENETEIDFGDVLDSAIEAHSTSNTHASVEDHPSTISTQYRSDSARNRDSLR